ncbi:Arrestin-C domain-containing protein [Aphelenchoides bicaudatus]|nr:Arrestin-C domain-containing protein [Aphelenchoides bicaudatus]
MIEFDLIVDKSYYLPGEVISGTLLVVCKKETKANFITLTLKSRSVASWAQGRTTCYSKFKPVRRELNLWKPKHSLHTLPAATTYFGFTFKLPDKLPPTFKSKDGYVCYWLEAIVDIPGLFKNKKKLFGIQVKNVFNLSLYFLSSQPQKKDVVKCYEFLKTGQVVIKTTTNKKAYAIGEKIQCTFNVKTSSPKRYIKSVEISLLKTIGYISPKSRKEERKQLISNTIAFSEHKTELSMNTCIEVPQTDSSFTVQNLYVNYFVMVKVRINGVICDIYPEVLLPVQIGTLSIMP